VAVVPLIAISRMPRSVNLFSLNCPSYAKTGRKLMNSSTFFSGLVSVDVQPATVIGDLPQRSVRSKVEDVALFLNDLFFVGVSPSGFRTVHGDWTRNAA